MLVECDLCWCMLWLSNLLLVWEFQVFATLTFFCFISDNINKAFILIYLTLPLCHFSLQSDKLPLLRDESEQGQFAA